MKDLTFLLIHNKKPKLIILAHYVHVYAYPPFHDPSNHAHDIPHHLMIKTHSFKLLENNEPNHEEKNEHEKEEKNVTGKHNK
jgi:hypothetical protein